jgi:hypothetical protein
MSAGPDDANSAFWSKDQRRMDGMELPDIYEVRLGRQAAAAASQGDLERAERLRQHIVAESATDAGEEAVLDEVSRAALLLRRAAEASDRGDAAESERLLDEMRASCSQATLEMLRASALLNVGREQGWLNASDHDELTRFMDSEKFSGETRGLLAGIERRES